MAIPAPATVRAEGPPNLRSRVLRGIAWKGASRAFVEVSKLGVGIILARALTPRDFGLAAMVMVFVGIIPIFSGLGLGAALVQRPQLDDDDRSTAFWTGLGLGCVMAVVGVALSPLVARFYGEPQVQPLFAALSVGFVITALGMTQGQLLIRDLKYRSLELRTMGGALGGAVVGVTAALTGSGPWAIILQQLAATAISTALLWMVSPWRPGLRFSFASLRRLAGFGGNVSGTMLLNEANTNADNLLIGRFLGPVALGTYAVAYNIMLLPFSRITSPLQEVLYAAFSRMQEDLAHVRSVWLRVNRLVAGISMPALLGLAIVAPDAIHVILGQRWSGAATVVRVLAWVGIVTSLQGLNASVLQACDRTGPLLRLTIAVVLANLASFVVGLRWGITGVAACFAISSTIVQPFYTRTAARAVGSGLLEFARNLAGVAAAAGIMAVAVLGTRTALLEAGVGPAWRLAAATVVGLATYVPACRWTAPEVVDELRRLRPHAA